MYEDAEEKRRLTQRNLGQLDNEFRQLRQEFSDFKEDSETHDPFENLDDTEVLDVATAKKILASVQPKKKPKGEKSNQSKPDPNFNNWMATQPGIEDINKYYKANEAEVNSKLQTVPTNEYGQFLMISSLQKDDHIKQQAGEIKKLQAKVKKLSKKKKVPQMGPSGNPGKGRQPQGDAASPLLRYFSRGRTL
jgi:DNA repair exonuclease SbcCD ATPase subunit